MSDLVRCVRPLRASHKVLATLFVLSFLGTHAWADDARHVRVRTAHGPLHLWTPAGYDARTAALVIYVHGYYTHLDRAWREQGLAKQFEASGVNALFVACSAPAGPSESVRWTSLATLLDAISWPRPEGKIVAVGHSAAYRTLLPWLEDERLSTVVLVDALYAVGSQFRRWLDRSEEHRLIDVASLTKVWADELHAGIPDTLRFEELAAELPGAREARVVYVRSDLDHHALISKGVALPIVLRSLRAPRVGSE